MRLMGLLLIAFVLLGILAVTRRQGSAFSAKENRAKALAAERDRFLEEQRRRNEQRRQSLETLVAGGRAGPREYAELASLESPLNPGKAQRLLETATRRFPRSVSLWAGLGRVHQLRQRPDRTLLAFRKANALDPTNVLVAASLANLYTTLAWSNEARKVLVPALKKHPDDPSLRMSLSRLERQSGNSRAARKAVESLCAQQEAPPQAHVLLAQALDMQGNRSAAAASFGKALAREPWNSEIRSQLADELTEIGTKESLADAEKLLREGFNLQPDPLLQRSLGILLARQRRHAEALEMLQPLTEANSDSQLLTMVATSLRSSGRASEATPLVARGRQARNEEGAVSRLLARANFRPRDPEPPVALARLYIRQKRADIARAEVLRALLIDPKHRAASKLAQELGVTTKL